MFPLLDDEDLGLLMQVKYASEAAEKVAKAVGTTKDVEIIREAVARELGKNVSGVADQDYGQVKQLDLSESELADIEPLKGLNNLQTLDLEGTQVADSQIQDMKKALPKLSIHR